MYILTIIFACILYTLVQRYILAPVLYWTGAVFDEFNQTLLEDHRWWFNSYTSSTLKEFYKYRKTTEGYDMYKTLRWFPLLGLFAMALYFIVTCIGVVLFMLAFFVYEIYVFIKYIAKLCTPAYNYVVRYINMLINALHSTSLYNSIRNYYNKTINYIANIKLAS